MGATVSVIPDLIRDPAIPESRANVAGPRIRSGVTNWI